MNRKPYKPLFWLCALVAISILAACSPQPRLVASYPSQERPSNPAPSPWSLLEEQVVYDAYIDMEVSNPVSAAERAQELAEDGP